MDYPDKIIRGDGKRQEEYIRKSSLHIKKVYEKYKGETVNINIVKDLWKAIISDLEIV